MKHIALAALVAACADETDPPWSLDHDRIVAVRATPPRILPGETSRLDGLIAHAGAATTIEQPIGASATRAPTGLFAAVHFNVDHWEINGPDEAQLDAARIELGLAASEPVPLEVDVQFRDSGGHRLFGTKTVWLGESLISPDLPVVAIDGVAPASEIAVTRARDVALLIEVQAPLRTRWFTSCGTLLDDDKPTATLRTDSACVGELAVVVRDVTGGVVWHVWPLRVD